MERIDAQAEVSYPDSGVSRVVMTRELLIEALGEAYTRLEAANKVLDTRQDQQMYPKKLPKPLHTPAMPPVQPPKVFDWVPSFSATFPHSKRLKEVHIHFPDGSTQTLYGLLSDDPPGIWSVDERLKVKSGPFKGKPQMWFTQAEVRALLAEAAERPFPQTKPAAWGMTYMGGLMPTVYVVEGDAVKEFKRRNSVYPDSAEHRKLVAVYTVPIEACKHTGKQTWNALMTKGTCSDCGAPLSVEPV